MRSYNEGIYPVVILIKLVTVQHLKQKKKLLLMVNIDRVSVCCETVVNKQFFYG